MSKMKPLTQIAVELIEADLNQRFSEAFDQASSLNDYLFNQYGITPQEVRDNSLNRVNLGTVLGAYDDIHRTVAEIIRKQKRSEE